MLILILTNVEFFTKFHIKDVKPKIVENILHFMFKNKINLTFDSSWQQLYQSYSRKSWQM